MTQSKMNIVEQVEDLAKQYKKISRVEFFPRDCKDAELTRLTTGECEYGRYAKEIMDYTSIVEIFTTASMLGYYISGYSANRGELWIDLTKDFKYDNISPDLVEFISRTVENNVREIEEHNNSMNKILDEIGMP